MFSTNKINKSEMFSQIFTSLNMKVQLDGYMPLIVKLKDSFNVIDLITDVLYAYEIDSKYSVHFNIIFSKTR